MILKLNAEEVDHREGGEEDSEFFSQAHLMSSVDFVNVLQLLCGRL